MGRSPGVTVSAVIAILGSLGLGALGAFMLLGGLILAFGSGIPNSPTPYPTGMPLAAILAIEILLVFGFAILGLVSAIGLLRLKNWARICFLVFAAILVFGAGSSALAGIVLMVAAPQVGPPNPDVPPGFMTGIAVVMVIVSLMVGALAIWWLIYFNRRTIKVEFMGEAAAALPRRGPLSMTIIGWLLVVGAFFMVISVVFSGYPSVFLGVVIEGWAGRMIYLLWAAVSFIAGLGLLKWRRWAHSIAIGTYAFGLFNTVLSLLTGAMSRLQAIIQERMPPTPYPVVPASSFFQIMIILAFAYSGVVFWILITRRRAFIASCEAAPPATS